MKRSHYVRCYRYLNVAQLPDDRLKLVVVHSVKRFDDLQVIILFLVFVNRRLYRRKVLLVAQINVVNQWAFAWQEGTRQLQGLGVPEL